jgi:integrase
MKLKLTAKEVERLPAPHPSGRQVLVWDSELRGFGVLLSGVTNSKSFVVQHDVNGRSRRLTIGPTNVLNLTEARARAKLKLADLYQGKDPKAVNKTKLGALLESYLKTITLRPRSAAQYQASITRYLGDWLDRPLASLTGDDIVSKHREIATKIKAEGRYTGEAAANKTMRTLTLLWNFAAETDSALPPCPTRSLKRHWYRVPPRTRHLTPEQMPAFYRALMELRSPVARDYLLLLLFTGMRREEAAAMTWADVDFSAKVLRIPGERTKNHQPLNLPMTDYVHDLLVARGANGRDRFVFPALSKRGYIVEPNWPLHQIALATGILISAHDLRRTYATIAESLDLSPYAIKGLINHSTGKQDITGTYIQMSPERLREPAQRVCDRLKQLCGVAPIGGDNVRKISA